MFKVALYHWDDTGERYGVWRESTDVFHTNESEELVREFVNQKNKVFIDAEIEKINKRLETHEKIIEEEKNKLNVLLNSNLLEDFKVLGLNPTDLQNKINYMEKGKIKITNELNEVINDPYRITGFHVPVEYKWEYESLEVYRIVEENGKLVETLIDE